MLSRHGFFPEINQSESFLSKKGKIDQSFLEEGAFFYNDKKISLNFDDPEEFEAAVLVMRANAVSLLKARQFRPPSGFKEEELQENLIPLMTPEGTRKLLMNFYTKEVPNLFSALSIPSEERGLLTICLHDRCKAALIDNRGDYSQAILRYIGKWYWVTEHLRTQTSSEIAQELKRISVSQDIFHPGDVIGPIGNYDELSLEKFDTVDVIYSLMEGSFSSEEILAREKRSYEEQLPSIGLEIQNFTIPKERFYVWKDYLRSHGIRSSWRPEFGSVVEASLPPSFSIENIGLMLNFLEEREFFDKESPKFGLHISLGIPATEDIKYIALCLMCAFPVDFDPNNDDETWVKSLGNVFSKGLIYRNPSTQPVHSTFSYGDSHSEIRVISIDGRDFKEFRSNITHALMAVQKLGKELKDGVPSEAFIEFKEKIKSIHDDFGLILLNHDWVFGTGDLDNIKTLKLVPIIDALNKYRHDYFKRPNDIQEFQKRVKDVFFRYE